MYQVSSRYLTHKHTHTHTGTLALKCNHEGLRVCRDAIVWGTPWHYQLRFFPLSSLRLTTVNVIILKLLGWGSLATKSTYNDIVAPFHCVMMLLWVQAHQISVPKLLIQGSAFFFAGMNFAIADRVSICIHIPLRSIDVYALIHPNIPEGMRLRA